VTEATTHPVRLALGGLVALAVAMGIGRFVYTPILPSMVAALGLTKSEAGLIASANFIGYLIGALLVATPFVTGSHRAWLIGGLALSAATTGLMGAVSSLPLFLLLRFTGGIASAFVLVFASTLILERLARAGRSGLMSVHFAGVGTGIAGSALLIALLHESGADWRTLWLASGVASLPALATSAWLIPGRDHAASDVPSPPPPQGGSMSRALMIVIAVYGLFGFGYVITATFIVSIVRASPAIAPLEPAIWMIVGLTAIPSVGIWVWIGGKLGDVTALALACLVEAAGVALSVAWYTPAAIVTAAVILGGTFMGITALGLAAARRLSAGDARKNLALMTAAFGLGQIIGPVFAGALFDLTESFRLASLVAAATLVVAAALAWHLRRQ